MGLYSSTFLVSTIAGTELNELAGGLAVHPRPHSRIWSYGSIQGILGSSDDKKRGHSSKSRGDLTRTKVVAKITAIRQIYKSWKAKLKHKKSVEPEPRTPEIPESEWGSVLEPVSANSIHEFRLSVISDPEDSVSFPSLPSPISLSRLTKNDLQN